MTATASADRIVVPHVRPGDGHPALARAAFAVTIVVASLALVLMAVNRPAWHVGQWYFLVDLADAFVYGAVGWVLLSRVSRPVVWIVVGCALGGAVAAVSMQWTELRADHPDLPSLPLLEAAQSWAWILGTLALILVAPWLVRTDPIDRLGRAGVVAGSVISIGFMVLRWTDPFPWPDAPSVMPFAIRDDAWVERLDDVGQGVMAAVVVVGLAAAADVARRWHRAASTDRRGLGWLAVGGGLMSITFAPLALPAGWTDDVPVATTPLLHLASQLFFPAALLVAVLGQRLWGVQLAVSRALAWSLLTATLLAGYAALLAALGLVLPGLADGVEQVAAAAVLAAAVDPIRRFVQRRVDHLVHGDARQPLLAIDRVGSRLGASHDPERLLSGVLEGLVDSLRLAGAAIDLAGFDDRIVVGRSGNDPLVHPLVLDGEPAGTLTTWPRPGERLDQRTHRALDALVPTVAIVARLAVTAAELRASRTRVVVARDDERAALRRELHDGLGPALAGIGYGIAAARTLLTSDTDAADRLLARMSVELDARVEEVRTLARELVPPVLVESGLGAALVELGARHRLGGLSVVVTVDEDIELGPLADSALYGIAAEALRNVARHAGATTCRLELRVDDDQVVLAVVDDGVGMSASTVSGVGLQSMRERASALGADLTVASNPGAGTTVLVRLPVAVEVSS